VERKMNKHPLFAESNMPTVDYDIDNDYQVQEHVAQGQVLPEEKDEDDVATEAKIDAVYDAALDAFNNQTAQVEIIDPRYAARTAEVAATYLQIALNAATSKAKIKVDRKKTNAFIPYSPGGKITNNTIVCSREDILKAISIDKK
jgi:hypothetical protein